ncbi:YceD family protein [Aestuariibius insulae]|uniref:YceD family protein n=1 Tax=Aestuariibius insulae TaxID=2058287 RepID=UPI00345F10B9
MSALTAFRTLLILVLSRIIFAGRALVVLVPTLYLPYIKLARLFKKDALMSLPEHVLRIVDLPANRATRIDLVPTAEARTAIAEKLGLSALKKLTFDGQLTPVAGSDWQLSGDLGATIVQPCGISLDPVTTRIDESIERTFTRHMPDLPDAANAEIEMPEDDTLEPLSDRIDVFAIILEALALAIPPFPRKEGAETGQAAFTEPGKQAMRDEDARPFAGLSDLREQLKNNDK